MKNMKKNIFQIVAAFVLSVTIIGFVNFSFSTFADTKSDLDKIFVTRDEFNDWKKNFKASGSQIIDLDTYMKSLEVSMQQEVQKRVKEEMKKRNIRDDNK